MCAGDSTWTDSACKIVIDIYKNIFIIILIKKTVYKHVVYTFIEYETKYS